MESQSSFHNRIEDIQSNPGSEEKIASTSPTIQTQPKNSHSLSVGGLSFLVENISHGSQDDYDDVIEKVTNPNSKSEQNSSQSERPFDNIPEISKRSPVDFWKSKTLSFLDSSKSTASSNSKPTEDDENPNNIAIDESESEFIADLIPPSKSPVKEPVTPEKKSLQPLDPPEEKVRRSPRHSQKNRETVEISDLLKAGILPVGSAMNMLGEEGIITKDGWIQYGEQKYSSFDLWFEAVCPRIGCVPSNFKPEERWTMVYVGEAPLSDFRTEYLDVFKFLPKSRRRKVFDEFQMIDREKRMKQKNTETTKDKNKSKIPRRKSTESDASHSASNSDSEHSASHSSAKIKDKSHKSSQNNNTNNSTTTHNSRNSNDKKHVSPTAVKVKEENTPVTPVKIKQEKTPSSTASNSVKIKQEPTAVVPLVEVVPPVPQPPVPTVLNSNNSPVLKSVKPELPQRNNSPPWITSPKKKKSASQSTDDGAVAVEEETLQRPPSPTKNFQKQKSREQLEEELQTTNDDVNTNNNNNDYVNMDEEDDDEAMAEQLITDSELMNDSEQPAKTWTRKRKRAAGDESDWVPKRRKKGEVSDNTVQTTFDNFAKPAPKPKSNPNSPAKPLTRVKNTSPTKSKLTSTIDTSNNNKDASTAEPMQVEETESQKKKSTATSTAAKEKKSPKKAKQTQLVLDTSGIVSTNREKEHHASSKSNSTTMTPKNPSPVILGSGLKSTMLTQIIALTTKLGGSIAKEGNEPFTHLVILPNKDNKASRTIKYLTALLKGRWIVSFEWILRSQADGKWLDEEEFEINGDAVANGTPERARSIPKKENEAIQVLKGYEFYFYGKFEAPLPSLAELSSLITLAGGKVLKNEPALPTSMKEILNPTSFLICNEDDLDTIKELQIRTGREALSVQWLLDSISRLKVQELREYKLIQEESEDPLLATQNSLAY